MQTLAQLKKQSDYFLIFLTGIVLLWVNLNINGKKDYGKGLIEADARGYYAYLPAIFIYHDLNFGFFDTIEKSTYYNPNLFYEYRAIHNGKTIDKYYAGTALCLSPFFVAGHLITRMSDLPQDGYSKYYVKSVSLAAIFYLIFSLLLLNKVLCRFNISLANRNLALMAMVFGTNLFYYSIDETCLSHIFSLAFISLFIYAVQQFFNRPNYRYLTMIALALGMIVLIRPVNILILLAIPFIAGGSASLRQGAQWIMNNIVYLLPAILVFALIVCIQLVIYKVQTGDWIVYSYKGEGFDFAHPQMIPILFSYRKGLFLYTPVYLLCLSGLYFLYRTNRYRCRTWLIVFIPLLYVISSWHNWYYGGSFSGRVFIEFLPLFIILLAIPLQNMHWARLRKGFIVLMLALIVICQLQTYQYRRGQIHWSDQTKEKYWDNFLGIKKLKKMI